jgi:hypothetical protein
MMKSFQQYLREFRFADLHPRPGEWKHIPVNQLRRSQKEPPINIDTELFDLLAASYSYVGGHIDFKKPSDIPANHTIWYAVDVDGDKTPDATLIGKASSYGTKWTGLATNGTPAAKSAYLSMFIQELRTQGNYCEVSGAIAHVLLTRYNLPYVANQAEVEQVLGKKVKWLGEHPEKKYIGYHGFYERDLGGSVHMKILMGRPA